MKSLNQWLSDYGVSHQNSTNKKIHRVCVPLIMLSLLGLLALTPFRLVFVGYPPINLAHVVIMAALIFYFLLSPLYAGAMLVVSALMLLVIETVHHTLSFNFSLGLWIFIFIASWAGQFWGHKIEGKKPSFLQDLAFLLIGPLWVIHPSLKKLSNSSK